MASPDTTIYNVRLEYSLAGANKWNTLCLKLAAPYQYTWATGGLANDFCDLRTVAGDSHSGVSQVQVQYARTGTSTWTELCPVTELPYSCEFNTVSSVRGGSGRLPDGQRHPHGGGELYDFRAVLTDDVGKETDSALVAFRRVDKSPPRDGNVQGVGAGNNRIRHTRQGFLIRTITWASERCRGLRELPGNEPLRPAKAGTFAPSGTLEDRQFLKGSPAPFTNP